MTIHDVFGCVKLKIDGFDTNLIMDSISKCCRVIELYMENETVYAVVPIVKEREVISICERRGYSVEVIARNGVYPYIIRYHKRVGIVIGIGLCILGILFLSNIALRVRVVGANSEEAEKKIRELAAQEGIKAGAYIPSMNFLKLEARLFELSDDIAWVSIGHSGSVITINVSMPTIGVESEERRIPCNIVASRDGVIVKADVLVGEFTSLIGSAVKKGDLLVSGIVENSNGMAYYRHSIANIIAEYNQTITIEQGLYDVDISDGAVHYMKYLQFFELDIPISRNPDTGESYVSAERIEPVKFFGITLPISVKTVEYTEQISKIKTYTVQEAENVLYERLKGYEEYLLSSQEIVSKNVNVEQIDGIVRLTADYTLRGDICQDSEIFIK
ncbi:MAG TPA: sporulation protein YqfD [Candidatus Faeciplasma pullistercoris]|uniref:Sporulation protein YqfD n=1 Tax=Candidatus Faeciplasma pullistercoris TaxID=2840800 RepID=A0A9D1GVM0_9FIRM|nr:sporulation protein YqfD [Candidatus Faeciplasma pullistercoris]